MRLELIPKQITFQIIHDHSLPIQLQALAFYRLIQKEFPHHNYCGTKLIKTNKDLNKELNKKSYSSMIPINSPRLESIHLW